MRITSIIGIYLLFWVLSAFIVLPFGVLVGLIGGGVVGVLVGVLLGLGL